MVPNYVLSNPHLLPIMLVALVALYSFIEYKTNVAENPSLELLRKEINLHSRKKATILCIASQRCADRHSEMLATNVMTPTSYSEDRTRRDVNILKMCEKDLSNNLSTSERNSLIDINLKINTLSGMYAILSDRKAASTTRAVVKKLHI